MMLSRRAVISSMPLLGATAIGTSLPCPVFAAAAPPLAMVMNSGEASVSIIDMTTRQVIKTTPTLREPSHWALSPDRSKLYIADASGNSLFILDPLTGDGLGSRRIADPYQRFTSQPCGCVRRCRVQPGQTFFPWLDAEPSGFFSG
jgi:YVTN family beta-propeller protein